MSISLIIPALNEAECLPKLLAEVPFDRIGQIIVVDNGSTDDTAGVALAGGAQVIAESRRGYGYACAAGVSAAEGEILVFMDGDGSFKPAEALSLAAPVLDGHAELVLGSRLNAQGRSAMPPHQRFGNSLFAWLVQHRFGLHLSDLGPFRAVRREQLLKLDMQEHTYGWPLEMILKAARHHWKIIEIPVTYRPRFAGQSKVGGTLRGSFQTGYRFFRVWVRHGLSINHD